MIDKIPPVSESWGYGVIASSADAIPLEGIDNHIKCPRALFQKKMYDLQRKNTSKY